MTAPEPVGERAPPRPQRPSRALVTRGRWLFAALAATLLTIELTTLAFQLHYGSPVAAQTCVRLVPGVALVFFIWRGQRWASLVLAAIFVLNTLLAVRVLVVDLWPWPADVLIGIEGAAYAASATVLFRSAALRAYQEHQRE